MNTQEIAQELNVNADWLDKAIWYYKVPCRAVLEAGQVTFQFDFDKLEEMVATSPDYFTFEYRDKLSDEILRYSVYLKMYGRYKYRKGTVPRHYLEEENLVKRGVVTHGNW